MKRKLYHRSLFWQKGTRVKAVVVDSKYDIKVPKAIFSSKKICSMRKVKDFLKTIELFEDFAYPLSTPRTKLSMKNEPITMRGTK